MASIAQIRGAHGLLGWSQPELARAAGLSEPTVKRFETAKGANVSDAAVAKMRASLEAAGVIFVEENGEGPGVRLRKQKGPAMAYMAILIGPGGEDLGPIDVSGATNDAEVRALAEKRGIEAMRVRGIEECSVQVARDGVGLPLIKIIA